MPPRGASCCTRVPSLLAIHCSRRGARPARRRRRRRRVEPPAPRPRLALALSGGGARGIAHIGALRALEEAGLPVDAIAANSMGAIVGGIYATGRTADELEAIVRSLDWASLFSGRPDRRTLPVARRDDRYRDLVGASASTGRRLRLPGGLLAEHRINRFLIEHLSPAGYAAGGDFDRLAIPFRAVATDLATGERVVLARGDLARAVRASMSIPVFFPPVDWEGRKLVDGLMVNNLPIDVAKAFGASVTVAIDIGSPPLEPEDYAVRARRGLAGEQPAERAGASLDFTAEADVLRAPGARRRTRPTRLLGIRRADRGGLRGDEGRPARDPGEAAGRGRRRTSPRARGRAPGPRARGLADRRGRRRGATSG